MRHNQDPLVVDGVTSVVRVSIFFSAFFCRMRMKTNLQLPYRSFSIPVHSSPFVTTHWVVHRQCSKSAEKFKTPLNLPV